VLGLVVIHAGLALCAANLRERSFDTDWRLLRGDVPGAKNPTYDDSGWRKFDVPRDWSIEELPPETNTLPEFPAVTGQWRFRPGDDASLISSSSFTKVCVSDHRQGADGNEAEHSASITRETWIINAR
jgi:hypothetical protein